MTAALTFLRTSNALLGRLAPRRTARRASRMFLRPHRSHDRPWEAKVEASAERIVVGDGLSALYWAADEGVGPTILCMHGWEGRATQFGLLAERLVDSGRSVVAIDAPAHGRSPGETTHAVAFARAMLSADAELGPFEGVVGHSMGAGATAVALAKGLRADRAALIAGPSSIERVLNRFAQFIGLPEPAVGLFIEDVEAEAGVPTSELDVARLAERLRLPALIVHDRDDREVPFSDGRQVADHWPDAGLLEVEGLGHRRVLRDPGVLDAVSAFVMGESLRG